jgi:predicted DNA-binding protein YlxM (UPF0122 family)
MDEIFKISLLLDFYGPMLTDRQYDILDLHINGDYSLGEIAEQLGISRQGVYDNVRRAKFTLHNMEQKLGLVKKFLVQKSKAEEILKCVRCIDKASLSDDDGRRLETIEEEINCLINGL